MATPFESALLNLKLFELRREPLLREARAWFLTDFNPDSLEDVVAALAGERNSTMRMVFGYWEMAASLVTTGAIDGNAFRVAHNEIFGMFCKIQPFLAEFRNASGEHAFLQYVEQVVMAAPDAEAMLRRRRERIRAAARARAQAKASG